MNLIPYTDERGEINLCAAFYDLMQYRRKGVYHFARAITELEDLMEVEPVYDEGEANDFIHYAVTIAYKGK